MQILGGVVENGQAALQEKILRQDVVDYVLDEFQEKLIAELSKLSGEMHQLHQRKAVLETEVANLTKVIAAGQVSPAIMAAISDREREVAEITERVISSNEDSVKSRIAGMREIAKEKLKDLKGLLGKDVVVARAALLKHVQRIEMEANGKAYVAKGNWNLLGLEPRDGAGGQNRTGYARLFRAALYQ